MTTRPVPMITLRMLRGACSEQKRIFKAEWPGGAEATLENVLRAVELGLDLPWGTRWFTAEARAEYERRVASIQAEYERQEAPIRAEYDRQVAPIRAEYERREAPIWAERQRQEAILWLAAFLASQEGQE